MIGLILEVIWAVFFPVSIHVIVLMSGVAVVVVVFSGRVVCVAALPIGTSGVRQYGHRQNHDQENQYGVFEWPAHAITSSVQFIGQVFFYILIEQMFYKEFFSSRRSTSLDLRMFSAQRLSFSRCSRSTWARRYEIFSRSSARIC